MTNARMQRALRVGRVALIGLAIGSMTLGVVAAAAGFTERIDDRSSFLLLATVVAVGLLGGAALCGAMSRRVPRSTVLELDLTEPLPEQPALPRYGGKLTLREVVTALERAATDKRVDGVVAWVRSPARGLASAQEVRDAIEDLRQAGKFAVAYAETFGEIAGSTGAYYLATAFDEIWLQPSGDVGLLGLAVEVDFFRGALDKLGIDPQLDHRREYKAAKNRLTETKFTPAHREASERIVVSLFDQIVTGIAERRGLEPARVRELVDTGPVLGTEAVQAGLVDRLGYRDEIVERFDPRLLALPSYLKRSARRASRRRRATGVALIYGNGQIVSGPSRPGVLARAVMGSDTVTSAFRAAVKDKRVKGILFRVDSPGGEVVASDAIRRAVANAREAGKPVVVSMSDVAGSGGYYVAMDADRIVAHPATITGSIGVVSGKAVAAGLKAKLGISHDEVHAGAHALISSVNTPYSRSEWDHLQRSLDRVYDEFVEKVASGRALEIERVHEIAKGRIWSGADAQARGLVDELGGYKVAIRALRELLDLPADTEVRLVEFPRARLWMAGLPRRGERGELAELRALVAPVTSLIHELTGIGALEMPEIRLHRW